MVLYNDTRKELALQEPKEGAMPRTENYQDIERPAANVKHHPSWGCEVPPDDPDYLVPAVKIDMGRDEQGKIEHWYILGSLPEGVTTVTLRFKRQWRPFGKSLWKPILFDLGDGLKEHPLI